MDWSDFVEKTGDFVNSLVIISLSDCSEKIRKSGWIRSSGFLSARQSFQVRILSVCRPDIIVIPVSFILCQYPAYFCRCFKFYGRIRINSEIKSKDHEDEYLLDNILDIKYYIHTNEMGKMNSGIL